jgi:hypothetical protein
MIQYFPIVTGSLTVLGNINVSGSITTSGSITISGSITSASFASTASFVALAQSASNAVSAVTASYADALTVAGNLTAQTLVVQTITSSVDFVTGSTRFGSILGNTHVFSGSVSMNPGGLFVSSSGNVGIGTNSPSRLLTLKNSSDGVNGISFQSYAAASENAYIRFDQSDDTLRISNKQNYATGGTIFYTNDTEKMRITSAGNVGIGTSAPKTNLQISNVSGADLLSLGISDYQAWVGGKIDLQGISSFGADMAFYTHPANSSNNATVVERMRIKSDGEVTFASSINLGTNQRLKLSGGAGNLKGSTQATISSTVVTVFEGYELGGVQSGNLVIISGVKAGTGWNFTDLVLYMTNGTITVFASTVVGSPPARTYTVSGTNLRLSIAGGDTGYCSATGLTQGYQA